MPNAELIEALRARLPDQFSRDALEGSLAVLNQADNKMRAHQFASTQRELFAHVLDTLAPDEAVIRPN
jgi:hypothetical protein